MDIDRRKFLRFVVAGAATAVAAPVVLPAVASAVAAVPAPAIALVGAQAPSSAIAASMMQMKEMFAADILEAQALDCRAAAIALRFRECVKFTRGAIEVTPISAAELYKDPVHDGWRDADIELAPARTPGVAPCGVVANLPTQAAWPRDGRDLPA